MFWQQHLKRCVLAAAFLSAAMAPACAVEFSFSGFADARVIAEPKTTDWLHGGLGKFRYGGDSGEMAFQGVGQGVLAFGDDFSAIAVAKADEETVNGVDALEAYLS